MIEDRTDFKYSIIGVPAGIRSIPHWACKGYSKPWHKKEICRACSEKKFHLDYTAYLYKHTMTDIERGLIRPWLF